MDERQFWSRIWLLICSLLAFIAVVIGGCEVTQQARIVSAIEKGVDPIAARCAISGFSDRAAPCIIKSLSKE